MFTAALASSVGWVQDRFVVSIWVDPIVPVSDFDTRYAELSASGVNVLLGGFGATTPDAVEAQVAACGRNNLKAIVSTCGGGGSNPGACVNSNVTTQDAFLGFQLKDEPSTDQFDGLATWSDAVAAAAPAGSLRFINLLPNYATPAQLNATSYGDYLSEFVTTVKPDILCMDHCALRH
jgi:hypothetical protein